jgi:hypothetical protein
MRINEITVADHADAWRAAGFTVTDDSVTIGRSFVIRLTGSADGGAIAWSLGVDGRQGQNLSRPGGLTLQVTAPVIPPAPPSHENGVTHCMKAVILTEDTTASIERLRGVVPELGKPPLEGRGGNNAHYAIWPLEGTDVGLEVVCLDPAQGNDAMKALFLVVDDLDQTIARIGAKDVTPVEVYSGRRMVRIKPRIGVTPGICLIAKS